MAKTFFGDYKGVDDGQLPVFTVSIIIQDLRTNKMAAKTSATYMRIGQKQNFRELEKTSAKEMRDAVRMLKAASEEADRAKPAVEVRHA